MKNIKRCLLTFLILFVFHFYACAQATGINQIKSRAEEKFRNYLPNIERKYDGRLENYFVLVGEMTGDNLKDIIIFFSIASNGGNAILGEGVVLYKNTGSDAKVVGGIDLDERISILKIVNRKLQVIEMRYSPGETGCCPSIKEPRYIEFSNNKLVIKSYPLSHTSDKINLEDVLINGKKALLYRIEFNRLFNKVDSTASHSWECGSPFEQLDKMWMESVYGKWNDKMGAFKNSGYEIATIYKDGTAYNSNRHMYLFESSTSEKLSFEIISRKIDLQNNISIADFQKAFPSLEPEPWSDNCEERFRLLLNPKYEDAFFFYFKDGYLSSIVLWWQLC